ncbi:MAG TPA: sulfatase/phosphatase domain-containing protein, partial [Nocardioides sp.]|nr:sulfatase/phosphatase domain-containing protein [Nocardioides sp.]
PDVVGTVDLAPTLADMAGTGLSYRHDGQSALPLAEGRRPEAWRRYFLIRRGHIFEERERVLVEPARRAERTTERGIAGWRGVVTRRWQYVRYVTGEEELYDGRRDPHQLRNILARPRVDRTREQRRAHEDLQRALRRLTGCDGVEDCRVR